MIQVPTKDRTSQPNLFGAGSTNEQPAPRAASVKPASEKQMSFLRSLFNDREHGYEDPDQALELLATDRKAASEAIDLLLSAPHKSTEDAGEPVTEGMYRKDGEIYKVQRAVHGSGNLYAKRLVERVTPKVMKTKTVTHDFEYAPGMVRRLTAADKMSLEEAKEWGVLYGSCCRCGATLTDEKSIANGIGPVCASKF